MSEHINIWAVATSAIVGLAINFVWFTVLLRDAYIAGLGRTKEQMAAGPSITAATAIQFVGFLVMSWGLAWLMQRTNLVLFGEAVALAAIIWLAFVAAIIGPMYAYQAFPLSLFGIVVGGYLLVLVVSGVILSAWR